MEHTKGEIKEVIECCNAVTILSKEDGSQIAQVIDEDGNDLTDTQKANAKELVYRWNAFEDLPSALKSFVDDEVCRFDHRYCQIHSVTKPCRTQTARDIIERIKE